MKIKKINQSSGYVGSIVDSLESASNQDALSANQGKILNETKANLVTTPQTLLGDRKVNSIEVLWDGDWKLGVNANVNGKKLEDLIKTKVITRYYFSSSEGKGIYRIYCLEKMGKYLLNSRGIECKWQPTDNTKPVPMIKKRLAGNQTIIAYLRKVKAFDSYVPKPAINAKMSAKVFKATGGSVKLTKNNKALQFVFEVVRREEEWEKKLVDKMRLYQDFYQNFVPGDSGFSSMPQLIFICEDEKHIAETFKTIVMNQVEIPQIKLYFSTDLRQNEETLAKTLVEFKQDAETKKYKMEDVEVKLLGI